MPLTNAEKQRRYKEKLKACGKYDHFRERHRNEAQKSRAKQKHLENTLSSTMKKIQQEARRVATRRRVAAYRERRKTKEAMKKLPFSSAQAYAKATARVRDRLPETPHRRKTVCRNLCRSELGDDIHPSTTTTAATPPTTNPRGLSDETVEVIQQFYQRDDISRQTPDRKDVVNIWPKEGGQIKKQMRHLTSSIMETFALFQEDYPNIKVGKSKFAELRPKHVLLSNKLQHNVCT
ncbi:uncharacterized protein [Apostichopus japonicus]|uniref:uncharacterized protein n=1 Tax=Stichopus japonicus TaxID=307972 RepID=UPI003AB87245